MTMFANRVHEKSPNIKVGISYGPVQTSIEENYQHLRHFHDELGRLINEVEAEQKALVTEV